MFQIAFSFKNPKKREIKKLSVTIKDILEYILKADNLATGYKRRKGQRRFGQCY